MRSAWRPNVMAAAGDPEIGAKIARRDRSCGRRSGGIRQGIEEQIKVVPTRAAAGVKRMRRTNHRMIIDIYTHILPDRFFQGCRALAEAGNIGARCAGSRSCSISICALPRWNEFGDYRQIIAAQPRWKRSRKARPRSA